MTRLPPLNALRAFEAAARHGGFIGAAEELHVTRGAISRQVKLLEDHLGVALFRRHARGVELTEAGRSFLPVLSDAFRRIVNGAARVTETTAIRIICPPAMSIRWLLPNLPDFRAAHPDIRIKVTTDFFGDRGFDGTEYDLGFSVEISSRPRAPGTRVEKQFPYILCPACAPSFVERVGLDAPEALARVPLLHESFPDDWVDWQRHFNVPGLVPTAGDRFPNFDLTVRAAVMGEGVVMADLMLCRDEIASGALVLPFPGMQCESPNGDYALIGAPDRWDDPDVATFRAWVAARAARDARSVLSGTPFA